MQASKTGSNNFQPVTLLFRQFSKTVTIEVSKKSSLRQLVPLLSDLIGYDIGDLRTIVKPKNSTEAIPGAFDITFRQLKEKSNKSTEFFVSFEANGG